MCSQMWKIAFGIIGTIVAGVAKAKKMEPKLPRIDQIIDGTAGGERLSFLDAYS